MDDVWKGTLPPQTPHLKFITSSVMSCISGQSSWQGMQLQSNQYCALSLSYFEKITNNYNNFIRCFYKFFSDWTVEKENQYLVGPKQALLTCLSHQKTKAKCEQKSVDVKHGQHQKTN